MSRTPRMLYIPTSRIADIAGTVARLVVELERHSPSTTCLAPLTHHRSLLPVRARARSLARFPSLAKLYFGSGSDSVGIPTVELVPPSNARALVRRVSYSHFQYFDSQMHSPRL